MTVVDRCLPPLLDTARVCPNVRARTGGHIFGLQQNDIMQNEAFGRYGSWSLIEAHYLMSFIPGANSPEAEDHEAALAVKRDFFENIHRGLMGHGIIVMGIGTSKAARRFQSLEEINETLVQAGFLEDNILITPTTDPLDFDEKAGKLLPGNFHVVAIK